LGDLTIFEKSAILYPMNFLTFIYLIIDRPDIDKK